MATRRIGEFLVAEGMLSQNVLARALGFQRLSGERVRLGSILLHWDLLGEEPLLNALSRIHRCPPVPWSVLSAAKMETVRLLSAAQAARFGAMPYEAERGLVRVAFIHPGNVEAVDEVTRITGRRVIAGVTTEVRMMQAHQRFYGRHVPLEFRAIIQKLERRTTSVNLPDLGLESAGAADPAGAAIPVPVEREAAPPPPPEIDPIVVPDLPLPPAPVASKPETIEVLPADDNLSAWVEEALSAFRSPAWNSSRPSRQVLPPPPNPRETPRSRVRPQPDPVADMWQHPLPDPAESIASGMWTPHAAPHPPVEPGRTRDEIADAVIDGLLTDLPRVVLLSVKDGEVRGWRGKGPDLTPERVATIRISVRDSSVFSSVLATGRPHSGPFDRKLWPEAMSAALGSEPKECVVFPIRVSDGVPAFLYADRLDQGLQYEDFARLARAAASTASMLARSSRSPVTL